MKALRKPAAQADNTKPSGATMQELAVTALTCPGFSEQQKSLIVRCMIDAGFGAMTTGRGMNLKFGGNSPLAQVWPFAVLARAPKAPNEIVDVGPLRSPFACHH